MAFIGNTPTTQAFIPAVDFFSGNGSTTAFTLSRPVASVAQVQAVVENVPQMPGDAYTVSGNTITFTSAPASGTNNIYVYYTSPITQVIAPSQGTVFPTSMSTGGPSWDTSGTLSATTLRSNTYQDASGGSNAVFSGVASPPNSMGFRNRLINSDMRIDQRNAGASVSGTSGVYTVDRWKVQNNSGSARFNVQRNAGGVTPPVGFTNYLGITSTGAYSVASTDVIGIQQLVEGFNTADFGWGASGAATITLSFWVRSSLTGTFGGAILEGNAATASYPFSYTISAANTWEQKTVTVAGPTIGTWQTGSSTSIQLLFSMGTGSTYLGTAGSWSASSFYGATGQTNMVGTNGATFYITGVQLEAGTVASPFERRDYGRELMMCQRYYWNESSTNYTLAAFSDSSTYRGTRVRNPVPMRASATYTGTVTNGSINIDSLTTLGSRVFVDLGNNTSTSDLTAITASAEL